MRDPNVRFDDKGSYGAKCVLAIDGFSYGESFLVGTKAHPSQPDGLSQKGLMAQFDASLLKFDASLPRADAAVEDPMCKPDAEAPEGCRAARSRCAAASSLLITHPFDV